MAKQKSLILLGYDDEPIAEKDRLYLSHTTNKIGGHADWPGGVVDVPACVFCGQQRPLVVQIYAPLEDSQFHRTLYVFACLNAPCSTQSQSWTCIRIQSLEKSSPGADVAETRSIKVPAKDTTISWCSGTDDWGDEDDSTMDKGEEYATDTFMRVDTSSVGNAEHLLNEENGNVIQYEKVSDEDDESNSMEAEPIPGFENLRVDETNANAPGGGRSSGAMGGELIDNLYTAKATAEIEGPEAEVLVVEMPVSPKRDLLVLLKQPQVVPRSMENLTLRGLYINVDEERSSPPVVSEHVRELLEEYQRHEEVKTSPDGPAENVASGGKLSTKPNHDLELYEKGIPMHGDMMFHSFMSKLQENPGQILRYSRNAIPLLISPIREIAVPPHCQYCKNEMICEIQLLPTLIEKLRFEVNGERTPIDFGNVLVWTCAKSCWDTPDKMRQELVLVQTEACNHS